MRQKAFISYAIKDSEQYVLTLLSNLLRNEGFSIDSSYDDYSNIVSRSTYNNILNSSLFIGIITKYGDRNKNVFEEWKIALHNRIPSLLLIEDSVNVQENLLKHPNVLIFNRYLPDKTINEIKRKINNAKNTQDKAENNNALGWILGGLAALAIIKLLSDD